MTLRRNKTIFFSVRRDTNLPASDLDVVNVLLKDINVQAVGCVNIVKTRLAVLNSIRSILPYYRPHVTIVKMRI